MSPFDKDFGRWCFGHCVRVIWVIPMEAASDGDSVSEVLEEFAEQLEPKRAKEIFGDEFAKWFKKEGTEVAGLLSGMDVTQSHGFLMKAEIQIRKYLNGSDSTYSCGWGYTSFDYFYSETLEGLGEKCQAWAEKRIAGFKAEKARAKA